MLLDDDVEYETNKPFWTIRVSSQEKKGFFYILFALAVVGGLAPFLEPETYQGPAFASVRAVAPMQAWAIAWFILAAVIVAFACTKLLILYMTGAGLALFIALLRTLTLLYGKVFDGVTVTSTNIMVWLIVALNAAYILFSGVTVGDTDSNDTQCSRR